MPSSSNRRRKKRRSRFRRYSRKFAIFLLSHAGLAMISVAYMLMGAVIFKYIEAPHELDTRTTMSLARRRVKHFMWTALRDNDTAVDRNLIVEDLIDDWENYKFTTINCIRGGYDGRQQLDNILWSFTGAFFYSLTTISTVGYGNIACRTTMGRAVTILYAIFGIPLMLLFLAITGDTFSITCKFLYRAYVRQRIRFRHWRHKKRQSSRIGSALSRLIRAQLYHTAAMYGIVPPARLDETLEEKGRQEVKEVTVPILVLTIIMVSYLVAGATLFCFWENWTFEEGFYFCFISLALIGFGDLFPGAAVISSSEARNKIIICAFYLLCGMSLVAMCFNLAQEDVIKTFHKWTRRFGLRKRRKISELSRRGSRSIDFSEMIVEGGPIRGPNQADSVTVGDIQEVLSAVGILKRGDSAIRRSNAACSTPPAASNAAANEQTRLLMANGNANQLQLHQDAMEMVQIRRNVDSEWKPMFPGTHYRKINNYQFL